jgi:hypothetical protein
MWRVLLAACTWTVTRSAQHQCLHVDPQPADSKPHPQPSPGLLSVLLLQLLHVLL